MINLGSEVDMVARSDVNTSTNGIRWQCEREEKVVQCIIKETFTVFH